MDAVVEIHERCPTQFTQEGKIAIIEEYIRNHVAEMDLFNPKYAGLLEELNRFDLDDTCFHTKGQLSMVCLTLVTKFSYHHEDVIALAKKGCVVSELFNELDEADLIVPLVSSTESIRC